MAKDPITDSKVELGKKLYFDPRLSRSNLISCNTCHNLALGGADTVPAAIGHGWTANPHHLNSPTVYNSVFFKAQFWDGRSPHLADQAAGPIQAGPEMAAPPALVVERINSIPAYVEEFKKAYGKDVKVDFDKITGAIATFEKTLVTPSRFDKFLNGDTKALTKEEQEGLTTFLNKGCTACHTGVLMAINLNTFVHTAILFPGGFTGLALLIQRAVLKYTNFEIPFTVLYLVLNAFPVYISFRYIGKKFTLYSLLMIVVSSLLTDVIPGFNVTSDVLLCSVFGGLMTGIAS